MSTRMGLGAVETLIERERRVAREKRNRMLGIATCFLAFFVTGCVVGFIFGFRYGVSEGQAREAAKPKRVIHVMQAAPWMGLTECVRACRSKDRMEKVTRK